MEDMGFKYHPVSTRFWIDEKREGWSDDTTLLALYLLTCPHRTSEGLFRLPKRYIEADLKWSSERLAEPFAQLLDDGFINYDERVSVMLLRNALKYRSPENPNQETAAIKFVNELPETILLQEFQQLAERFAKRFAKRLAERYAQPPTPTPTPKPTPDSHSLRNDSTRTKDVKVGEGARHLATILYDWLKEKDAVPAAKGWFMRQAGIAENQLLKARPVDEWVACFEWAREDQYWSQHLVTLGQLGEKVWPQFARSKSTDNHHTQKPYSELDD